MRPQDLMPFRFGPRDGEAISGASFSPPYRMLATLLVGSAAAWFLLVWSQGKLPGGGSAQSMTTWFVLALALMLLVLWYVLRGQTRIDRTGITQDWVWRKHVPMADLAIARVIRMRGLDWLIAPRLYVRTLGGKLAVFHIADARVLAEAERLCLALQGFRRGVS